MSRKEPTVGQWVRLGNTTGVTTRATAWMHRCQYCVFGSKRLTYCMMVACNANERNDGQYVYFEKIKRGQ